MVRRGSRVRVPERAFRELLQIKEFPRVSRYVPGVACEHGANQLATGGVDDTLRGDAFAGPRAPRSRARTCRGSCSVRGPPDSRRRRPSGPPRAGARRTRGTGRRGVRSRRPPREQRRRTRDAASSDSRRPSRPTRLFGKIRESRSPSLRSRQSARSSISGASSRTVRTRAVLRLLDLAERDGPFDQERAIAYVALSERERLAGP